MIEFASCWLLMRAALAYVSWYQDDGEPWQRWALCLWPLTIWVLYLGWLERRASVTWGKVQAPDPPRFTFERVPDDEDFREVDFNAIREGGVEIGGPYYLGPDRVDAILYGMRGKKNG